MHFTINGSSKLENRIAQDLFEIREAILARVSEDDLSGLVLGGGYGRGEGGVFIVDGEERVYNDYDFFVIVPGRSRAHRKALMGVLAEVKASMEPRCGIHVDFSPAMPQESLATLPYEVMFMELKEGHYVVIGPHDILATMPDYDIAHPPLAECTRLFMNRGVGLLLARQKLEMGRPLNLVDHEFVVRNIRKAQLAMGDALLYLKGCYSPSYLERRALFRLLDLEKVPDGEILSSYYEEALEFKFCPNHDGPIGDALQIWYDEVTRFYGHIFLWFEQYRLGDPGLSWESYQQRTRRLTSPGVQESVTNVLR
ncbi:MAG: hypothetical protein ABW168_13955, partial [Sedimenticola sp.]